jgi:hypothetical protein
LDTREGPCHEVRRHDGPDLDRARAAAKEETMIQLPDFTSAVALIAVLFLGIIFLVEVGRRLGVGRNSDGLGGVERAVFGLMALLMAFTFSSAALRFELRRNMLVEEANAIRTAYLRLEMLPAEAQPKLREAFRRYVDVRLTIYRHLDDEAAARADVETARKLQGEIWTAAVTACRDGNPQAAGLVLSGLNAMFALATTRTVGLQTHQHGVVIGMLGVVMLACALLAGFSMGGDGARSWLHVVSFAAVLTVALYVILDLEYPRLGFIRIDWMDRFLEEVRRGMG